MKTWLRNKMDHYKNKKNFRDLYLEKVPVISHYVIK